MDESHISGLAWEDWPVLIEPHFYMEELTQITGADGNTDLVSIAYFRLSKSVLRPRLHFSATRC